MTQRSLKLAEDLSLPLDAVTQTIAILAKRRAGKSYTMRRLAEQLFKAGQQIVLIDPKGDQWGLRSAADGKGPGLPVVILGGERGDVPLEPSGGEVVAKLVVEERVSVLLDISLFRKHEVATFMTAFLENLYRLKAREIYRTPMMLVIDEADAIAPQKPQKGEERMLGAAEDIVRRGGQRGIGCVLVTQRSAVLNKNVLTQAQMLVALRTIAPQDLDAMNAWIEVHGTREQQQTLMASLPALPVGDAWFWSPGWPTTDGIFKRVHVLPIETFDSGATPKPGEKPVEPKHAADVDLDALKRQMSATIEKAKTDDPRELRKQIAELKKQIANPPIHQSSKESKIVAKPVLTDADRALLKSVTDEFRVFVDAIGDRADRTLTSIAERARAEIETVANEWTAAIEKRRALFLERLEQTRVQKILDKLSALSPQPSTHPTTPTTDPRNSQTRRVAPTPATSRPARLVSAAEGNGHRPSGEGAIGNSGLRRMLTALAQRPQGLTRRQLGVRATLSSRSGTFDTYLSKARTNGWIEGAGSLRITEAGVAALGHYDPLPEGAALLDHWLRDLGSSGAARILRELATVYPRALTRTELGEAANLSDRSGTFDTYLSRLRTLELIEGRGELRASEELFS